MFESVLSLVHKGKRLEKIIVFLAPTGAQGVIISVRLSNRHFSEKLF